MKTAKKEIVCVSLYQIRASGLKETVSYKYLLLSLTLIKQQNGFEKEFYLYSEHYAVLFFPIMNTTDRVLFVTYAVFIYACNLCICYFY